MLRSRVITALVGLPIIIAMIFAGGVWFLAGITFIGLVAGWEFGQMMKVGGYATTPFLTLALIVLLVLNRFRSDLSLNCIISSILLVSLVWQLFRISPAPTADWALTLAGGLYIGWGLAHLIALRQLADGPAWIWLTLLSTWCADSLAYLAGRFLGRHKLWPRHSPKKTWEGVIASFIGGLIGAAVIPLFSNLTWPIALPVGVIAPAAGLFGDLSISMMKRHVGLKDSSALLPGHGGFLDRLDSLLFVGVVVFYYAIWSGVLVSLDFGAWISGLGF